MVPIWAETWTLSRVVELVDYCDVITCTENWRCFIVAIINAWKHYLCALSTCHIPQTRTMDQSRRRVASQSLR
jgi:hypothetical protein